VERYPAIGLFIQRARSVKPDLVLTGANIQAISEICRRLDGLPLAIEFAAARSALFTPQELLAQLDHRFMLLAGGARDLPPRHITLWRSIDWSYSLLSPSDQQLFRQLSVFSGDFTLEAVEADCKSENGSRSAVLEGISVLVAGSLLQRREGYDGHSRFGMLETVRDFASSQLSAAGEAGATERQHAGYFLGLAQAAERVWDGPTEWDWTRRLVSVRNDLRAALRWSLETADLATALQLNSALFSFWTTCAVLSEARQGVEAALALPHPHPLPPELAVVEAKVLNIAGYLAAATSNYHQATAYFERGLALYREVGDSRAIAWSIRGCAYVRMLQNNYPEAAQLLTESRRMCEASGDAWGLAWSLYALAFLKLCQHELAQARLDMEEALQQLRRQNMTFGVFRALLALAFTVYEQGDPSQAGEFYRAGLSLSRDIPMLTIITTGLEGLGMVAAAQGFAVRAARLGGAAEALREVSDERRLPIYQRPYDQAITAGRRLVSPAEWAEAWQAGRSLTAAQAVDEGLEEADTTSRLGELNLFTGSGPF
jgi:non-specific serine/threonine protein kinase